MQPRTNYLLGVDFGSDSVRCLVVDAADGSELASAVVAYPRWAERLYCDPAHNRYRQHPLDYVESLEASVRQALAACGRDVADAVCGISFDTTASTPALTDAKGTPLALLPEFAEEPDAMFVLWKDHTALAEADEINDLARKWKTDYTRYSGGTYSCEWVWAKMLHCLRRSPGLAGCGLFVGGALRLDQRPAGRRHDPRDHRPQPLRGRTQGDVARLVGRTSRAGVSGGGRSAAGHLPRTSLFRHRHGRCVRRPAVRRVAPRLGLKPASPSEWGPSTAMSGPDGAGIVPGTLVKVMGTSTCDIVVGTYDEVGDRTVRGICGQVDGSVLPGYIGFEAGQASFGDLYAWFRRVMAWPLRQIAGSDPQLEERILGELTAEAERLPLTPDRSRGARLAQRPPDARCRPPGAGCAGRTDPCDIGAGDLQGAGRSDGLRVPGH